MNLAIDIGNTSVKAGIFQEDHLLEHFRFTHESLHGGNAVDPIAAGIDPYPVRLAALSSVVPSRTVPIVQAVRRSTGIDPLVIRHDHRLPITLGYADPAQLGIDRIAAASAARSLLGRDDRGHGRPVVVVDAGTAVTFSLVDENGVFRGGLIWAGLDAVQGALSRGTAQLPRAEGWVGGDLIANTTDEAIRAGTFYGFLDGVAGMLRRILATLSSEPFVVATGRSGELLADHLPEVALFDPFLVLRGVSLILRENKG